MFRYFLGHSTFFGVIVSFLGSFLQPLGAEQVLGSSVFLDNVVQASTLGLSHKATEWSRLKNEQTCFVFLTSGYEFYAIRYLI